MIKKNFFDDNAITTTAVAIDYVIRVVNVWFIKHNKNTVGFFPWKNSRYTFVICRFIKQGN